MTSPQIKTLSPKKLAGKRITTTLAENRTYELWNGFMPRRKEINNGIGTELFSVQIFDASLEFKDFNQDTVFEKWAAVEVKDFNAIPFDLESYILSGGLYAVFLHQGPADAFSKTSQYIFTAWLPHSHYEVDNTRAHFEVMGRKYKNNDPGSEEEVWIPIKLREK